MQVPNPTTGLVVIELDKEEERVLGAMAVVLLEDVTVKAPRWGWGERAWSYDENSLVELKISLRWGTEPGEESESRATGAMPVGLDSILVCMGELF